MPEGPLLKDPMPEGPDSGYAAVPRPIPPVRHVTIVTAGFLTRPAPVSESNGVRPSQHHRA